MRRLWLISLVLLLGAGGQQVITGKHRTVPAAAPSGPAIVQPTSGNPLPTGCSNYPTASCLMPLSLTSGNTLRVGVMISSSGCTLSLPTVAGTATVGSFTTDGTATIPSVSTNAAQVGWYSASITGTGIATVTETYTGCGSQEQTIAPFELSSDGGLDSGTNPVYNQDGSYCTNCSTIGISTATSNDAVLYMVQSLSSGTFSSLTPYTMAGTNGNFFAATYIAVSAGSISGTFTSTAGNNFNQTAEAIK